MDMQVLLEKSSIFTEVLKDQMGPHARETTLQSPVATQKAPDKYEAEAVWPARIGTRKDAPARGQ